VDRRTIIGIVAAVLLGSCIGVRSAGAATAEVDPLPHQLHPNDWPQPDYFSEALKLTRFLPGERFKALKLAAGLDPDWLVLPVQLQVFGWTPAFAAIIGARLDHELARRGLNANRQTDLFDADGPYLRRFEATQIDDFAAAHPRAQVLALYLGRDATGKDFVTLTLRRGSQLMRAHRSVKERPEPSAALEAMGSELPGMLAELGLAGESTAPTEPAHRCDASDWTLDDLNPRSDLGVRACRALITGVLLPEFGWPTAYPRPRTPAKLAWLAEAYVESDALMPVTATAVRSIAWSQLELGKAGETLHGAIDVDDAVARPLARLLWARERTLRMPVKSRDDSADAYAAAAAAALPAFAQAVFIERAGFEGQFRRVEICALERQLPALRVPPECAGWPAPSPRRTRLATRAERELLDEWRLTRSYKDIDIEGRSRGDLKALQAVLDALPPRIAAHPFIRQERFASESFGAATGTYESLVKRAQVAVTDFVQATADLQRWNIMLPSNAVTYGPWTNNAVLRAEPPIKAVATDEQRMMAVLELDGFIMRGVAPQQMAESVHLNFLRPGSIFLPQTPIAMASAPFTGPPSLIERPATEAASGVRVPPRIQLPLFMAQVPGGSQLPTAALEQALAADLADMDSRTELALARMKAGQSLAQARALIDGHSINRQSDAAIEESHAWAYPAHAFFFAAELDAARQYYQRVKGIGTGSESDLHSRVRLRLIAGDIPGALQATRARLERYESDFARRDLAGLEFLSGYGDRAWSALQSRLPQSAILELWVGAQVGQRIQGMTARQVRDWIGQSGYGHATVAGLDIGNAYLHRFVVDDRLPSDDDVALMEELDRQSTTSGPLLEASARLKRLAFEEHVDDASLQSVRELIARADWSHRSPLKPLYAWVAWRASGGKDEALGILRTATIDGDFDSMLAKALLLGLENDPSQAMIYLRAARIELAELSSGRLHEEVRSAPYTVALANYLLYRSTQDRVYRDEALKMARAYQRVFTFLAWPYALEALLSSDGPARSVAACRAQYLDRDSLFLKLSGLNPEVGRAACRKSLW